MQKKSLISNDRRYASIMLALSLPVLFFLYRFVLVCENFREVLFHSIGSIGCLPISHYCKMDNMSWNHHLFYWKQISFFENFLSRHDSVDCCWKACIGRHLHDNFNYLFRAVSCIQCSSDMIF